MKAFGAWFADQGNTTSIDPVNEEAWPDGLSYNPAAQHWEFDCRACDRTTEWLGEPEEFEPGHYANVCGGSPSCCP